MKRIALSYCIILLGFSAIVNAQTAPDFKNTLKHVWDFEGGTVEDLIGDADGKLLGGATISNGILELLSDEKIGGYVSIPGELVGVNEFPELTLEIWCTPEDGKNEEAANMLAFLGGVNESEQGNYYLSYTPSKLGEDQTLIGRVGFALEEESCWEHEDKFDFEGFTGGNEVHAVVTISGTTMKVYHAGVEETVMEFEKPKNAELGISGMSPDSILIGRGGYWGDATWNGTVEKMALYNSALSEDNIKWLTEQGSKFVWNPTLPVDKANQQIKASVYASNGNLIFSNYENFVISSVEVYNVMGGKVFSTNEFSSVINTNLPASLYIVKVESNHGLSQQKILIK